MFRFKTNKKHIIELENNLVKLMASELSELKRTIKLSKVHGINFTKKPEGIHISRGYEPKDYEEILKHHRSHFNLLGVWILKKKTRTYEELKLNYLHDSLTFIEIENPEYFHKNYDPSNLKKEEIKTEKIVLKNPDLDIAKKALKTLKSAQLEKLDLDGTFEIELDEKLYYTILDMEDGNYIATNKKGQIFRLNHDHQERVKQIAETPKEFFEIFKGNKAELEHLMNK